MRQHAVRLTRVKLRQGSLLERFRHLKARRAQFLAGAAQHARARVFRAVDAVAEAHQPVAAVEGVVYPALGIAEFFDLLEHLQDA